MTTTRTNWEPFLSDLRELLAKHGLTFEYYDDYDDGMEYWFEMASGDRLPMIDMISWIHPLVDKRPEIIKHILQGTAAPKPLDELPPSDKPLHPSKRGGDVID